MIEYVYSHHIKMHCSLLTKLCVLFTILKSISIYIQQKVGKNIIIIKTKKKKKKKTGQKEQGKKGGGGGDKE